MSDISVEEALLPRVMPVDATDRGGGWFAWLAAARLRKHAALRGKGAALSTTGRTEAERAQTAIRAACVKCALTGAAAAGITTAAEVLTAECEGLSALATVPAAMLAIGGEMVVRAAVHLDLTCDLAEIFGVPFDDDGADFWRLYALAFRTADHADDTSDPGRLLVENVLHLQGDDVAASIGSKLLGESVLRNIVPVAALATSSMANWAMTRRVGDTVERSMRYRRAFRDAMRAAGHRCAAHGGLLAEGLWFLFTADGRLSPEETAALASLVRTLAPDDAAEVTARFVEDDYDWLKRLDQVPESERDDFLHALEVAATVDMVVSLPERKILRGAARALGRGYDEARVRRMVRSVRRSGRAEDQRTRWARRSPPVAGPIAGSRAGSRRGGAIRAPPRSTNVQAGPAES